MTNDAAERTVTTYERSKGSGEPIELRYPITESAQTAGRDDDLVLVFAGDVDAGPLFDFLYRASAILGKNVQGIADLEGEDNTLMLDFFSIVLGNTYEQAAKPVRDGGLLMDEMRWTTEHLMGRYGLDGGAQAEVASVKSGDDNASGDNPPT